MNLKSKHMQLVWNREDRTAVVTVHYQDVDGCLYPKSGDQSFAIELKEAEDAWKDLQLMLTHISNSSYPQRLRLSDGKLLGILLWRPLLDALHRFVEVIGLGLPIEPHEFPRLE